MEMIVAAWNYEPEPKVSPVRNAVQAYMNFYNPQTDKYEWGCRRIEFYINRKLVSPETAVMRLLEVPVLTWNHPYNTPGMVGAPPQFSPEDVAGHRLLVSNARKLLRDAGLSEHKCDRLNHVVDFESFNHADKAPLVPGASYAVKADHATTACHLFGQALAACSWDQRDGAGAANYHTCHAAEPFVAGSNGAGTNRATPQHVPGSLDGRTTCISGYTTGGPHGCLTEAEVLDAVAKAPPGSWLVIDDHQPGRGNIIRAAKASGRIRLLLLWGTVKESVTSSEHRYEGASKVWQQKTDATIASELKAAGWGGN